MTVRLELYSRIKQGLSYKIPKPQGTQLNELMYERGRRVQPLKSTLSSRREEIKELKSWGVIVA